MGYVVYNACFGSFSLSREAVLRAREISGDPKWGGATIRGDESFGGTMDRDYGYVNGVPRHDPVLVRVVQELGDKANGDCASLRLAEVASGTPYRIEEYDGRESVLQPDDYEYEIMP